MASTELITNGFGDHHLQTNLRERKPLSASNTILCNGSSSTKPNGLGKPRSDGSAKEPSERHADNTAESSNETNGNSQSARALAEVRRQFIEYAEQNPDRVNERDRIKLTTDDWYLKRYLLARNRRVADTMNMLRNTMEWRNEFGIHISEDAMFPLEFYKIGALFPYECDREGNLVLYMRIKYHRKIDQMVEVEKHFLVHTFEKIDRITNGQGLVIVFDCQGAGYANCDLDFLLFLISTAKEHAPIGLKYILVYKLPWVLNALWGVARKVLPAYMAKMVRFCDEKSVREFIEPANLPDFMDGYCRRNYRWIPPGCPSVFKLANAHGITDAEIDEILPQFQSLLDEAEEALSKSTYEDPPETITKYVNNALTAPNLLSDLALCSIGFAPQSQDASGESQQQITSDFGVTSETSSIIRLFPDEFIEFNYDAYNDAFHATVTLLNPSEKNSLAFKLMSNRPMNYSVRPARGVLAPNAMITLSIVLLNEHKFSDKFLIIAQPLEGQVESISKAQFDSLWSANISAPESGGSRTSTHTTIKLGSYVRQVITTPAMQSSIKNPQVYELVTACRSLRRRQSLSIMINVILLVIIINLLFFN